jgi:hypothetical protein
VNAQQSALALAPQLAVSPEHEGGVVHAPQPQLVVQVSVPPAQPRVRYGAHAPSPVQAP